MVTCSDASETGGGLCFSSRLSRAGRSEAEKLVREGIAFDGPQKEAEDELVGAKVLVIDLFAGLGGLEVALEKAGVKAHHSIMVEKDVDRRRLLRRKYPGSDFCSDITKFNEGLLKKSIEKVPGLTGIIVGGGSPCQGLSKLSSEREHLLDERSALFYEAVRVMEMVDSIAQDRQVWTLKFLENVVPDEEDIDQMSAALKIHPVLVESGKLSRVRRPRLYWLSAPIGDPGGPQRGQGASYDVLRLEATPEPVSCFLKQGVTWPAGEADENLRFPTFTRSIPRRRPPPCPAGLASADEAAQDRGREDEFRYPPYVYAERFLKGSDEILRPLIASEREVLMGYQKGYTAALLKKMPETDDEWRKAEDLPCAASGNSFHTNTVAAIFDKVFAAMGLKKEKGVEKIVDSFVKSLDVPPEPDSLRDDPMSAGEDTLLGREDDEDSIAGEIAQERLSLCSHKFLTEDQIFEEGKTLSVKLVSAFIRRQELLWSDVRLDVGSLYRPEAFPRGSIDPTKWLWHVGLAYRFKHREHINVLKLRALVGTFEWRLRSAAFTKCRALHLTDSVVALSVSVKGRSSSRTLNRILRRFAALQCAGGICLG